MLLIVAATLLVSWLVPLQACCRAAGGPMSALSIVCLSGCREYSKSYLEQLIAHLLHTQRSQEGHSVLLHLPVKHAQLALLPMTDQIDAEWGQTAL